MTGAAAAGELSTGFGASLLQMTLALVAVSALAVLILWLARRRFAFGSGPIKVIARQPLDARHTLFVVEAAGRQLLVGAGDGGVSLVAELDPPAVAGEAAGGEAERAPVLSDVVRSVAGKAS